MKLRQREKPVGRLVKNALFEQDAMRQGDCLQQAKRQLQPIECHFLKKRIPREELGAFLQEFSDVARMKKMIDAVLHVHLN